MEKIKAGYIVKVVYLPTYQKHFGHLGDVGMVTHTDDDYGFFIKFLDDDECGWWEIKNVIVLEDDTYWKEYVKNYL